MKWHIKKEKFKAFHKKNDKIESARRKKTYLLFLTLENSIAF